MAKIFRKVRQGIFGDNQSNGSPSPVGRYLLYAAGEIILVVIGILIALQINTWSQQREQNREEKRLLTNLRTDLQNDISQLQINITSSLDRQANVDTLLEILAQPKKHTIDRFITQVYPLFYESHFDVNSGTFDESLASGTIKYVQDDLLRQQIFEYYRDAKLSYADKNAIKITYELLLPQFFKTIAPSKDFVKFFAQQATLLPKLNLSAISMDKDFYAMLILKDGIEDDQLKNWKKHKEIAQLLLQKTEEQL